MRAVIDRAIELKQQGLTVPELLIVLKDEGYTNPNTGRPFTQSSIQPYTAGINSQIGKRNPRHKGKTAEEIEALNEVARLKRIEQMRAWRKRNPDYCKQYANYYKNLHF